MRTGNTARQNPRGVPEKKEELKVLSEKHVLGKCGSRTPSARVGPDQLSLRCQAGRPGPQVTGGSATWRPGCRPRCGHRKGRQKEFRLPAGQNRNGPFLAFHNGNNFSSLVKTTPSRIFATKVKHRTRGRHCKCRFVRNTTLFTTEGPCLSYPTSLGGPASPCQRLAGDLVLDDAPASRRRRMCTSFPPGS